MPLASGAHIGPYEIVSTLGVGGMGEVYRARDAKLHREVAIKVLPATFASDPDRLERFEREAHALASLNHPHIAHVYGLEDGAGDAALVMELVEGEDLAERIARGPISPDEAFGAARQIADALEAAHEQGIIHRDLKPANVKVRPDGVVKVLDFGLAKVAARVEAPDAFVNSATVTSPAMTQMGIILGTAAYMAPEQARGKPIDRRIDIWAFGCILYEMLTGSRPFDGPTMTDVLSAIITKEPDWATLPTTTPPAVRSLLRRCLEKDPRKRLRDIGDARLILEEPFESEQVASSGPVARSASRSWLVPLAATAVVLAVSTALLLLPRLRGAQSAPGPLTQFDVPPPQKATLNLVFRPVVSVAANGSAIAFSAISDGVNSVYVRSRQDVALRAIADSEGGSNPAVSPNGQWVAFFAAGAIRKAPIDGRAVSIGSARDVRGLTWIDDDMLVFTPDAAAPLVRMSAQGGDQVKLSTLAQGERTHRWPSTLPGGKAVIFSVGTLASPDTYEDSNIDAVIVATGERRTVLKGAAMARYCGNRRLVYAKGASLFAVSFDPDLLTVSGNAVPIVEGVERDVSTGAAHFDCAADGTLTYVPGSPVGAMRQFTWVDGQGAKRPVSLKPGDYQEARLSPEGGRVAFLKGTSGSGDVWVYDFSAGTLNRLTFTGKNAAPMWSADGQTVYYTTFDSGGQRSTIVRNRADGSRQFEPVREVPGRAYLTWIDGKETTALVDSVDAASDRGNILLVRMNGSDPPEVLVSTTANEYGGTVSPDGRWLAYQSDETGRPEIFVRDFAGRSGARWQVTSSGGEEPHWSPNGRELFYRTANRLLAVALADSTTFRAGSARPLFDGIYSSGIESGRSYDIDPKTGRFLLVNPAVTDGQGGVVRVVLNWDTDLGRNIKPR
jgi:serine/threonine protein kinase/Tol biopolymer transport system component